MEGCQDSGREWCCTPPDDRPRLRIPVNCQKPFSRALARSPDEYTRWPEGQTRYRDSLYSSYTAPVPTGPAAGSSRVLRGGSCCRPAGYCHSATRESCDSARQGDVVGLRMVVSPRKQNGVRYGAGR